MKKTLSTLAALALAATLAVPAFGGDLDGGMVLQGGGSTGCCRSAV